MYGMYTCEGDETISEVMTFNQYTGGRLDIDDILNQIQLWVEQKGKDQVNPYKNYGDDEIDEKGQYEIVVGFEEVTDSVVRDNILDFITDRINNYNLENGYKTEEESEDDEDYEDYYEDYSGSDLYDEEESNEDNEEESNEEESSDGTKRKRESDDDCKNSKPSKSIKK